MNDNQINAAEFSGAPASPTLFARATAVAQAVVTGARVVYRNFSATITAETTVLAVLRNQYNGVIIFATEVIATSVVNASIVRTRLVNAVVSQASTITALLLRIKVFAAVSSYATVITAKLQNQYNGLIQFSTSVSHQTTVQARIIRIRLSQSIVSAATNISLRLQNVKRAATNLIVAAASITSTAYVIKRMRAVLQYTTSVTARLSGIVLVRSIMSTVSDVVSRIKASYAGKTTVNYETQVSAELMVSRYAPAAPENTFYVPEDELTYDVEE